MKKFLLSLIIGGTAVTANAQTCNELFISEYVEGTNSNKAIELYNPTWQAINLADYRIIRWSNGTTQIIPNEVLQLPSATIASKDVFVLVINTTDAGLDTVPFADLAIKADAQLCPSCDPNTATPRTLCFNGDDALSLQKNVNGTWVNVDIFGLIGEQPTGSGSGTAAWTNIPPYSSYDINNPQGIQANVYFLHYWTQNQTMIRKPSVLTGVKTNPGIPYQGAWNPATEWDTLPVNTFSELGSHVCDCLTLDEAENPQSFTATIYPNPSAGVVNVRLSENIKTVQIYNIAGQLVRSVIVNEPLFNTKIDATTLNPGLYLVRVESVKGHLVTKKVTIQ